MRVKLLFAVIILIITGEIYFYFSIDRAEQHIFKLAEIVNEKRVPGRIEPMPNVTVVERYRFDDWENDVFSNLDNRIEIRCKKKINCLPKIVKAKSVKLEHGRETTQ